MTQLQASPLIIFISVRDLFGRRSYDIDIPTINGKPSRLLLLHGDNGSGKTTLLRLIWHTLSAAENKGHRSYLAKTPFSELVIRMSDSRQIRVNKSEGLVGSFTVTLNRPGLEDSISTYEANEDLTVRTPSIYGRLKRRDRDMFLQYTVRESNLTQAGMMDLDAEMEAYNASIRGEKEYLDFLATEVNTPLFLADDRSLYSDDPDINRMRELLSRREDTERRDRLSRFVFIELQVTMRRVNDYLRSLTLGGQNDGSANSNAIYMTVLRRLVQSPAGSLDSGDESQFLPIMELLDDIASISPGYEEFELVPKFDAKEFRALLASANTPDIAESAQRVIYPFLSSLRARYNALKEAHDLLQTLIPSINNFLSEKNVVFTPQKGLRIVAIGGESLEVESLSSGERQLLMLLCTTVLARIDTNVFIIDEPELSLGVEWQRNILDAVMQLTQDTNLQFLVATHSIEIISSRAESLALLRQI